jgi:hypothetical protein
MNWESSLVESHQRLIQKEFDHARTLFEEQDKRSRLIENDARRCVVAGTGTPGAGRTRAAVSSHAPSSFLFLIFLVCVVAVVLPPARMQKRGRAGRAQPLHRGADVAAAARQEALLLSRAQAADRDHRPAAVPAPHGGRGEEGSEPGDYFGRRMDDGATAREGAGSACLQQPLPCVEFIDPLSRSLAHPLGRSHVRPSVFTRLHTATKKNNDNPKPTNNTNQIKDGDLADARTDADDWYLPKPQPSKKMLARRAIAEARRKQDEAQKHAEELAKAVSAIAAPQRALALRLHFVASRVAPTRARGRLKADRHFVCGW